MKKVSTIIAVALALAAAPPASIAQPAPKVALGVAMMPGSNVRNVKVLEIRPGGTADRMGIRAGDMITHAGGQRLTSKERLIAYINRLEVGDPVELTVTRRGESLELTGTAQARTR